MLLPSERKINKLLGQLLFERGMIPKTSLVEALKKQSKHGGFLGEYLVEEGLVTEKDIVQCISSQYGLPYIELTGYKIERDIVNVIPSFVAEKYRVIPIDKIDNILTLAMSNPLDGEAISAVELITDCRVQAFIATISDINFALEKYYELCIIDNIIPRVNNRPITVDGYAGPERRRHLRFKANINVHFAFQETFRSQVTKDVSAGGISFFSENKIPLNTFLTIEIILPREVLNRPIASVVKIARVKEVKIKDRKKFEIGAELVQINHEDKATIVKYARKLLEGSKKKDHYKISPVDRTPLNNFKNHV